MTSAWPAGLFVVPLFTVPLMFVAARSETVANRKAKINCSGLVMKCLGAFQLRDLREYSRSFGFQRGTHGVEIFFRELSGFVLEVQVAQVLVNHFFALAQIYETC